MSDFEMGMVFLALAVGVAHVSRQAQLDRGLGEGSVAPAVFGVFLIVLGALALCGVRL